MNKPAKDESKVIGGIARANALTPEQKKEIAKKAAAARWGDKPPVATHKGNFKEEFGIDVECHVLDDANKTAVISQTGMATAIGLSSRGNAFPRFLESKAMVGAVGAELKEKLSKPIKYQWGSGGAGNPQPTGINGYDATLLIEVCQAIVSVEDKLAANQKGVAKQAYIILGASAKSGIKGLVYALAGYNPSAEEVIAAFKLYVLEEAKKYEQEFPPEIYIAWHRLYQLPVPVRGKPWQFKHLTLRHIYYPLAKSSGRILELLRAEKSKDGDRQKKLFQFLSEVGTRALRIHLGRVLEIAESASDKHAYEAKIAERFGGQQELDLVVT
ncbi:MAG: hypothetical protein HZC23_15980 [Rhodocyclales bacterium]|nr:hypothetical protein [Rhodocyclales bacterium]